MHQTAHYAKSVCMPILMYAAETWTWTKKTQLLKSKDEETKRNGIRGKKKKRI
jgi:hypothetical protein